VRHTELVRAIQAVPDFEHPRAADEQVATPAEAAAELLELADRVDPLAGRSVLDLGCGTGRLAIGAALLGADPVRGVDRDPAALDRARSAAAHAGVTVAWEQAEVGEAAGTVDVVVMNPPFGAQRRHADRPFWDRAFLLARRGVYAFALAHSRTFIERQAVARHARIVETHAVPWSLARSFPHHTRDRVSVPVDLWAFQVPPEP
jgi:putative methylase